MKLKDCPVHRSMELIGGKWKPIILFYLKKDTKRSSELVRLMPEVSMKVLTQQLRELEQSGLIHRRIYPTVPPKVEYFMTKLGRSLLPALQALADFGAKP